jgi:hypothetical protein
MLQKVMEQDDRWVSEKELAPLIGRGMSTIRKDRMFGRGVPFVKIGGSIRYRLSDVVKFMEAHTLRGE